MAGIMFGFSGIAAVKVAGRKGAYHAFGCRRAVSRVVVRSRGRVSCVQEVPVKSEGNMILPHKIVHEHGSESVFFVHGWPDNGDLWNDTMEALPDKYRCVSVTVPHFGGREEAERMQYRREGYKHWEMTEHLAETLRVTCPSEHRVTMVIFDWGAFWGFKMIERYPNICSRVIAVDVGPLGSKVMSGANMTGLFMVGIYYQYRIIFYYLLARFSDRLRPVADKYLQRFASKLTEEAPLDRSYITADAGYPYYFLHIDAMRQFLRLDPPPKQVPQESVPPQPVLFMYGKKKPLQFFDKPWLEALQKRTDGSQVYAMDCAHWIMIKCRDEFIAHTKEWLDKTDAAPRKESAAVFHAKQ
mmetsp:Transcript_11514/g.35172  ORF Transcript_11514/g.35172 Transcript_11514/m.35172 type:complete len:356 (-) Transcript_11514:938-2005(-)